MTFYEVQAKSIINRVPARSRMPFEWTINPYRGCSHACVYCLAGDTPILMADGGTRPLAELRVGDAGHRHGPRRAGPALRRDHGPRPLVDRQAGLPGDPGRRHRRSSPAATTGSCPSAAGSTSPAPCTGVGRRPHLTTANRLAGVGGFAAPPAESSDYRRGYLCGFVHGDGHVGPVAPAALARARHYATRCGGLHPLTGDEREFSGASVRTASSVLDWPAEPTRDWRRGFLAGLFDADGSDGDRARERPAARAADRQGARSTGSSSPSTVLGLRPGHRGRAGSARRLGGAGARRAARAAAIPALCRSAPRSPARSPASRCTATTACGWPPSSHSASSCPMFDITTGTGDFIANGVVSHNCFARNTHTYLDLDAGHDFDTKVVVKVNARRAAAPGAGRADSGPGAPHRHGHQCRRLPARRGPLPADARASSRALRDFANPFSILTKGTLIPRDLDLLRAGGRGHPVGAGLSVGFVDETLWRSVEPGTPSPAPPARRGPAVHRRRLRGQRADGADPARPHRHRRVDRRDRRRHRRGRRGQRHAAAAAPASGRPGVVCGVARPRAPGAGAALPRRSTATGSTRPRPTSARCRPGAAWPPAARHRPAATPAPPACAASSPTAPAPAAPAPEQLTLL